MRLHLPEGPTHIRDGNNEKNIERKGTRKKERAKRKTYVQIKMREYNKKEICTYKNERNQTNESERERGNEK